MPRNSLVWLAQLERHDPWERQHAIRVATYAVAVGHRLSMDRESLQRLRVAAELHDMGKLALADRWEDVTARIAHPGMADMFLELTFSDEVRRWVRQHHERIDGSGYPIGLMGAQIDREAQIIGLAEYFDVAYNGSPFSERRDIETVRMELDGSPAFDPELVRSLFETQHLIQPVGV